MKKIITIVLIMAIIAAGTVFAFNTNEITAYIEEFVLEVNGNKVNLENQIVTINDRSYLPVRELSKILGFDVQWDENTKTISIDNTASKDVKDNLYSYYDNGKYGFMDRYGNVIIPAKYDTVYEFSEDIAVVGILNEGNNEMGGRGTYLYGCINKSGEEIVPCVNDEVTDFSEGFAIVREIRDEESYFIDKSGEKQFGRTFFDCRYFHNGYAAVKLKGAPYPLPPKYEVEWGLIDTNGKIYDFGWTSAIRFEYGYAIVKKDGKYGLIDTDFNLVLPYEYDDISILSSDRLAIEENGTETLRDLSGEKISDEEFIFIGGSAYSDDFSENGYVVARKNKLEGYIDKEGNIVIPLQYKNARKFKDGYASVVKEISPEKYINAIIDESGNSVVEIEIPGEYPCIEVCEEGLFLVKIKGEYDEETGISPYSEYYYLDKNGNRIDPILYKQ